MKKFLLTFIIFSAAVIGLSAQQPAEASAENIVSAEEREPMTEVKFAGFHFSLPSRCIVDEQKNSYVAKYPDGSFGISVTRTDSKAPDAGRASTVVRGLARQMHIDGTDVKQLNLNGMKGAIATGRLEGKRVSIAMLVGGGREIQLVVMNSPERDEWTERLLKSLGR